MDSFWITGNIIHYSLTKSKRVIRSVLVSKIYRIVLEVNIAYAISTSLNIIIEELRLLKIKTIVCIDLYSLYKCLVKLRIIKEKHLIINIIVL